MDPQIQNSYSYGANNPISKKDATGRIPVDTIADAGFILYDLASLGYNLYKGNTEAAQVDRQALGLDITGAALPYATGLGAAMRVGKGVNQVSNLSDAVKSSENLLVCRGGGCGADEFIQGTGVKQDYDGVLTGVSVNVGKNEASLVDKLPSRFNGQYGIVSKALIEKNGGTIVSLPTKNNPYHSVINGLTGQQLNKLFTPSIKNIEGTKIKK